MTLQEKLKALNLNDDQLKDLNGSIDEVINGKLAGKDAEFKKLQGDLQAAMEELKPFKTKARQEKIVGLVGELTDSDKLADAIELAKLDEKDTDEIIVQKVQAAIDSREWLKKSVATPEVVTKVSKSGKPEPKKTDKKLKNL